MKFLISRWILKVIKHAQLINLALVAVFVTQGSSSRSIWADAPPPKNPGMAAALPKTDAEWKKVLSPAQYHVLREKATEQPFSGKYNYFSGKGSYTCAACGNLLFNSNAKFDAGEGWPSFSSPSADSAVTKHTDNSMFMSRTEVNCSKCGSHLEHVFDDGPKPTGLRYCINSVCLNFKEDKK